MIVRFAVICDLCGTREEEYGPAPWCPECGRDVCRKCAVGYDEETGRAKSCVQCVKGAAE